MPHPVGIVVGDSVILGARVTLMQHATLGGNFGRQSEDGRQVPTVGMGTFLGPGAAVLGPVMIESASLVPANAVVTRDFPGAGGSFREGKGEISRDV